MNNFFYREDDFSLFQKALKQTKDEPIIINILSTDSSLKEANPRAEQPAPVARKNMSSKFQANPFNKFFGPRKQRTTPVDMSNFSSWKNKNYREAEQKISAAANTEAAPTLSLSEYMSQRTGAKMYNEVDQAKTELQKPINELPTTDPIYKKYSLDSYLHKLEQQSKVKDEFEASGDILEPLMDMDVQEVVPTSGQDEVFASESNVSIEDFSFDDDFEGNKYSVEREELDKMRERLDKIEREAKEMRDAKKKEMEASEEFDDDEDDDFDFEKLGFDDDELKELEEDKSKEEASSKQTEETDDKIVSEETDATDEQVKPKAKGKYYYEINKMINEDADTDIAEDDAETGKISKSEEEKLEDLEVAKEEDEISDETSKAIPASDDSDVKEVSENEDETKFSDTDKDIDTEPSGDAEDDADDIQDDDIEDIDDIEEDDIEDIDDIEEDDIQEIDEDKDEDDQLIKTEADEVFKPQYKTGVVPTFEQPAISETYGEDTLASEEKYQPYGYQTSTPATVMVYPQVQTEDTELQKQHEKLQAQLLEMIEENKKNDIETEEKLRQAKLENQRLVEEYEEKLKNLEDDFKQRDEEIKKQVYIDKLKHDIKLKDVKTDYNKRAEEFREIAAISSKRAEFGMMLKKELEKNLNIANLEMDKKLLEISSNARLEEEKQKTRTARVKVEPKEVDTVIEEEKETKTAAKKPVTKSATPRKRATSRTTRPRTRTTRKRIDSDIIGGIDFE